MIFRLPRLRRGPKKKKTGRVFKLFAITDDGHVVIAGYVNRYQKRR